MPQLFTLLKQFATGLQAYRLETFQPLGYASCLGLSGATAPLPAASNRHPRRQFELSLEVLALGGIALEMFVDRRLGGNIIDFFHVKLFGVFGRKL